MEIRSQGLKLKRVTNKIYFSSSWLPKYVMDSFPKWQIIQRHETLGRRISVICQGKSPSTVPAAPASWLVCSEHLWDIYPSTNDIKPSVLWSLPIVAVICIYYSGGKRNISISLLILHSISSKIKHIL